MKESKKLRRSLITAALALLAALFSVTAATFAWYIYNTSARTTKVEMAAGSSVSLQISNARDGEYKSSAEMADFEGSLNPVSTDKISQGFQRAEWFDRQELPDGNERLFAALFGKGEENVDYHKTSLFLRTSAPTLDIYLSDIRANNFSDIDSDPAGEPPPIATALRLGLVVMRKDENGNYPEYIFDVTTEASPYRETGDNADRFPSDDHVLDSTKDDGTTIEFHPYNSGNFCNYDKNTGSASLKPDSKPLFTLTNQGSSDDDKYGAPVEVQVYLWLEGCDLDCTLDIAGTTLENLTLSFAGYAGEGA